MGPLAQDTVEAMWVGKLRESEKLLREAELWLRKPNLVIRLQHAGWQDFKMPGFQVGLQMAAST